ncbi:MAG TPA: hypothetical protein GX398_02360 [Candidatus Cloacimonetes bacterium]|jgi:hypothetical protein|nr:hypothetical protein [Candidatus Cloacimonas sp.]HHZ14942.1 hypothetical protein [Candidatus Cloacimonadota bacterium]
MKSRFFFMTLAICVLLAGWIVLEYQYEQARQEKYQQLSQLPTYIYVADSTRVAPLLERLADFETIGELNLETGLQAADELIHAYQLAISFASIREYEFPHIITLKFKPIKASVDEKTAVMRAIAEHQIPLSDIDAQSIAWNRIVGELNAMQTRWITFTIVTGLLLGLLFFFMRFAYELRFLLLQKKQLVSVADALKKSTQTNRQTWLMFLIPLIVAIGGYFILGLLDVIPLIIPLWWFTIPAGVLIVATFAINLVISIYIHDQMLQPQFEVSADEF